MDEKVRKEAMDRLIYRELAIQEAARQGMTAAPEKIGEAIIRNWILRSSRSMTKENLRNLWTSNIIIFCDSVLPCLDYFFPSSCGFTASMLLTGAFLS